MMVPPPPNSGSSAESVPHLVVTRIPDQLAANVIQLSSGQILRVEANAPLDQSLTAWIPLLTPIAMKLGSRLVLDGPAALSAMEASRKAQAVLGQWYPSMSPIEVEAEWSADPPRGKGVGVFFSGGVDSFYSLLEHADEITHLIFVTGFDIGLHKTRLAAETLAMVHRVATSMGKQVLHAQTNLRRYSNRHCDWGTQYHGAALAGIAHLFANTLDRAIIPASSPRTPGQAWGSHPNLDPLWSSTLQIVHDDPLLRSEKVARLSKSELAMSNLRVCYSALDGEYNCGRCEKCLRTMISLTVVGALDTCATLPHSIDPDGVRSLCLTEAGKKLAAENLDALRARPERNVELEEALVYALRMAPKRAAQRRRKRRRARLAQYWAAAPPRVAKWVWRRLPEQVRSPVRTWRSRRSTERLEISRPASSGIQPDDHRH